MNANGRDRGYITWRPTSRICAKLGAIKDVLATYHDHLPMTVRQVFYVLVARLVIQKTALEYRNLAYVLRKARRAQIIPFERDPRPGQHAAGDPVRVVRPGRPRVVVRHQVRTFDLDPLTTQPHPVILWCEAAGMLAQLKRVGEPYGVDAIAGGSFDSITDKWKSVQLVRAAGVPFEVLHVGDLDRHGKSIFEVLSEDVAGLRRVRGQRQLHQDRRHAARRSALRLAGGLRETGRGPGRGAAADVLAAIVDDAIRARLDLDLIAEAEQRSAVDPRRVRGGAARRGSVGRAMTAPRTDERRAGRQAPPLVARPGGRGRLPRPVDRADRRPARHPGSIIPDGPAKGRTFRWPDDRAAALRWIGAKNAHANIYFAVNLARPVHKKPTKADLEQLNAVHADVDPIKGRGLRGRSARGCRLADELAGREMPPTFIIDSGGGIHVLRRAEGCPVEPNEFVQEVEDYNDRFDCALGSGDPTWNADRMMRLPGTVNWPDHRKRDCRPRAGPGARVARHAGAPILGATSPKRSRSSKTSPPSMPPRRAPPHGRAERRRPPPGPRLAPTCRRTRPRSR